LWEQAIEQQAAFQGLLQGAAVDQRVAHHGEGAALARTVGKTQVFVVQPHPEHLQQPGKLLWRDAGTGFGEQLRGDAHLQ